MSKFETVTAIATRDGDEISLNTKIDCSGMVLHETIKALIEKEAELSDTNVSTVVELMTFELLGKQPKKEEPTAKNTIVAKFNDGAMQCQVEANEDHVKHLITSLLIMLVNDRELNFGEVMADITLDVIKKIKS